MKFANANNPDRKSGKAHQSFCHIDQQISPGGKAIETYPLRPTWAETTLSRGHSIELGSARHRFCLMSSARKLSQLRRHCTQTLFQHLQSIAEFLVADIQRH
jgi:hypothetical protein